MIQHQYSFVGEHVPLALTFHRRAKVRSVISYVTLICEISLADFYGTSRPQQFVRARAMVVWVLRQLRRDLSYPLIGKHIGRDHTSVHNLHRKATTLRNYDPEFAEHCDEVIVYFTGKGFRCTQ